MLAGCHVAVLSSAYEGFGLAPAEAMAIGLPVVAFDCGGVLCDYLKDQVTGFCIRDGDIDAFADAIERFHLPIFTCGVGCLSRHSGW